MMKIKRYLLLAATAAATTGAWAQSHGLTDTSQSRFAKMANTNIGAVQWTSGFWADRLSVYSSISLQSMWDTWNTPEVSHGYAGASVGRGLEAVDRQRGRTRSAV